MSLEFYLIEQNHILLCLLWLEQVIHGLSAYYDQYVLKDLRGLITQLLGRVRQAQTNPMTDVCVLSLL